MSLTCITCKVLFSIPELHHEHYKSEWHRYNLKRRVAELPSLTKDEFEARAAAFQDSSKEKEKVSLKCDSCSKYFSSENAMSSHLKSKKHLEMETAGAKKKPKFSLKGLKLSQETKVEAKKEEVDVDIGEEALVENDFDEEWEDDDDGDWESCDEEDEETIVVDTDDCLFCDHHSDCTENNVSHMREAHSFFIPDIEFLSNLDGLIAYLAGKIRVGHICLWCDGKGKGFKSAKSVRQHMLDKGHTKMLHEGEALLDYADFYDYSTSDAQEEIFNEDVITDLLEHSDYELVLPSGATLGHRSLALYYKQNLQPLQTDNQKKVKRVLQQYKALGYLGTSGPAAIKKARDIVFVQRLKSRYNLKLSMKNNKLLQPHFRKQVMF